MENGGLWDGVSRPLAKTAYGNTVGVIAAATEELDGSKGTIAALNTLINFMTKGADVLSIPAYTDGEDVRLGEDKSFLYVDESGNLAEVGGHQEEGPLLSDLLAEPELLEASQLLLINLTENIVDCSLDLIFKIRQPVRPLV